MWAVWPDLLLTMRLNLIEGLEEIENSKAKKTLHDRAAQFRSELERAQVLMRDPRSWEGGEKKRKKSTPGRKSETPTTKPKNEQKPDDDDEEESDDERNTWLQKDEDRLQGLFLDTGEDDDVDVIEHQGALCKSKPTWRPAEFKFCEHYFEAKNLVPGTLWKDTDSNGVRALSRAHQQRFERSKFTAKRSPNGGFTARHLQFTNS